MKIKAKRDIAYDFEEYGIDFKKNGVYVAEKDKDGYYVNETENGSGWIYAQKIADIKMSVMPISFANLFTKDIDYTLYIDSGECETNTDMYGIVMKYTDVQTVIDYLEKLIDSEETYRRLPLLLGMLKGIDTSQWDDIQIVHYGY